MRLINMQKDGINAGSVKFLNQQCILQKHYTEEYINAPNVLVKIMTYEKESKEHSPDRKSY